MATHLTACGGSNSSSNTGDATNSVVKFPGPLTFGGFYASGDSTADYNHLISGTPALITLEDGDDCLDLPDVDLLTAPDVSVFTNTGTGTLTINGGLFNVDSLVLAPDEFYAHDGEVRVLARDCQVGAETVRRFDWGITNISYLLLIEFGGRAPETLDGGTFPLNIVEDSSSSGLEAFYAVIAYDANNDEQLDRNEGIIFSGGSIEVSGDDPEWQLGLNLTYSDGQSLTGSYNGDVLMLTVRERR